MNKRPFILDNNTPGHQCRCYPVKVLTTLTGLEVSVFHYEVMNALKQ